MTTRLSRCCAAAVLSIAGFAHAGPFASLPGLASAERGAAQEMPQLACVLGFSKDYCTGLMHPGHVVGETCISPTTPPTCRTVRIDGATFDATFGSNPQTCGSSVTQTCDEVRDGRLKVSSAFTIRAHPHCPYRGCWVGRVAEFVSADGSVYSGTLLGTIGVGTHRPSTGPMICAVQPNPGRNCERCYDVQFDSQTGLWRVGYEAAFHGSRIDVATGEELCFSLSGDFLISGTAAGGPNWSSTWRIAGTADGVNLTFCP